MRVLRNPNGFFSIDAMFAVTLLLMIVLSFTNVYEARTQMAELMGAKLEAQALAEKIAGIVNVVHAGGENMEIRFRLPKFTGGGFGYVVHFNSLERCVAVENAQVWGTVIATVGMENVVMRYAGENVLYSAQFENSLVARWGEGVLENWIEVTVV